VSPDATPCVCAATARRWSNAVTSRCGADLGGQFKRPVEAGAEPVGKRGVGLVGGPVRLVGAGVEVPRRRPNDRQGDRDDGGDMARATGTLLGFDETGPAKTRSRALLVVARPPLGSRAVRRMPAGSFPPGQGTGAKEAEHGGQERDGGGMVSATAMAAETGHGRTGS